MTTSGPTSSPTSKPTSKPTSIVSESRHTDTRTNADAAFDADHLSPAALATTETEFAVLVAEHAEAYRPPVGALVHPETTTVTDPHAQAPEPNWAPLRRADLWVRGWMGGFVASFSGILASAATDSNVTAAVSAVALCATGLPLCFSAVCRDAVVNEINASMQKPTVVVPADVGSAYRAYHSAPALLRTAHASEMVVGSVEDQLAYVDMLLVEAARLHALDASATAEGIAVRDAMVRLAAQAQALVTMAQRQRALVSAATLTTPMLLSHQPSPQNFADAAAVMSEETALVRGVLGGPEEPDQQELQ